MSANLEVVPPAPQTDWSIEKLLSEIERLADLGSWEWEVATDKVTWSEELYRIYQLDPETFPATFAGYLAQVHPDDREKTRTEVERAFAGASSFDHEERIVREDGTVRILRSRGRAIPDASGRTIRMVGTCQDLTELKETELALRRAQSRLQEALRHSEDRVMTLEEQARTRTSFANLVGKSSPMQEVYRRLRLAAQSDVTVLLTGESGTGKELAAAAIHSMSERRDRPFIGVNCSAIPDTLMESEFFGHLKGAFTGAVRDKAGLFLEADGGTLFLDEVGDMSPALQVKVLRALQEQEIRRVGDERNLKIDVRLIAATNRDLQQLLASGRIREDFYYRINVFNLPLPPLRERQGDIPLLVEHFLRELSPRRAVPIAQDALQALLDHPWPGNVRELRNVIEYGLVMAQGGTLRAADLPPEIRNGCSKRIWTPQDVAERERLRAALADAGGNRTRAAAALGTSRVTLWKKLRRFNLMADEDSQAGKPVAFPMESP
ncbi:MAG TPA: sigma 54-interacting transcriptional regulator [Planctomycetota bacterium]|nr:sigma 54-interacting transcriptional regulator [Planctomycetota bacterium]